ncbi:carbohydrate ABC transporter permease [Paenibacillus eucommiae]|uniref:Aldouronate transport system permease protein n=1 Tax=Paenibacillus eucommiae TaxID=1355755 RepID=A0ABS4IPJ2_9BACL|nr:carbohydrate ABC transporter permease [Paenibacillus eucommiae]MBP1988841.1 putative aldouronate transport system permease protein [Paenibacillus eucommiae]
MNYRSPSRIVFEIVNIILMIVFSLSILIPFFNVLAISVSDAKAVRQGLVGLWPVGFQLDAYKQLISNYTFMRSMLNTVFLTVTNTSLVILFSLSSAYALSSKNLIGRKPIFYYFIITMFFSGGLVPTYLLVNNLGLYNTYGALIFPSVVSIFYIIVFKNVIDQLPKELLECAEIDGAGDFKILFKLVLPLVLPMTMAFVIFSAVGYWNEWFSVLIYTRDQALWTLQYQLRDLLTTSELSKERMQFLPDLMAVDPRNLKMAALMLTVLPIIAIYPFVQKYFIHGQLVGAVKG